MFNKIKNLEVDGSKMLPGLKTWVQCESPTFNPEAVNRMQDIAVSEMKEMGATIDRIKINDAIGDCLLANFPHSNKEEPGILIMGHMDTVHPIGTIKKLPFKLEGEICYGPGICDMKGGNYIALEAIRQIQKLNLQTPLPVSILFTSDEEIGSPYTRKLIESEASASKIVLVPEPARRKVGVVSGRYAIARYAVTTHGRPSHAGANLKDGRSAIKQMAKNILRIESMTTSDCTFSVGVVSAGQWVNCVATEAKAEVLSMSKKQDHLDNGIKQMMALNDDTSDCRTKVALSSTRPVWEPQNGTFKLLEITKNIVKQLDQPFLHASAGGGSDGNFTGAMGIPTLDGLGVSGDKTHTLHEHIEVASLEMRTKLMMGLLLSINEEF